MEKEIQQALEELRTSSSVSIVLVLVGAVLLLASFTYSVTRLRPLERQIVTKQAEINELDQEISRAKHHLLILGTQINACNSQIESLTKKFAEIQASLPRDFDTPALARAIQSAQFTAKAASDTSKEKPKEELYYVIAMTSSKREDIEDEIRRIRKKVGAIFDSEFPDIKVYPPEGGPYTLLISRKSLPYAQANELKERAIGAGFSKDTWLWQSRVEYFSSMKGLDKSP